MPVDVHQLLHLAKDAAEIAAAVHHNARRDRLDVQTKGGSIANLVTEIDRESERQLVAYIRLHRPDDSILGEEESQVAGTSGVHWVIDPLDGTTNFVHGYPHYAVSIGIEIDGKRVIGVIADTANDHLYSGIVGEGAWRDGHPIFAKQETQLEKALVATGFQPDMAVRRIQAGIAAELLPQIRDLRRSGSAACDFCAVASGVLDAFYENGLSHWDISGGAAIAEAAGARVIERPSPFVTKPLMLCANPALAEKLLARIAAAEQSKS